MIITGAGQELYSPDYDMLIKVTRVAKDGSWADIKCYPATGGDGWTKRQKLIMGALPYAVEETPDQKERAK